jgi:uncharacterized membrane protein YhaH (DUF805 family)
MLMFRPLLRYADFKGRASRTEYWLFMVVQAVFYLTCVVLAASSFSNGGGGGTALLGLFGWLAVAMIGLLVFALPNYAVLARRLHDAGLSAFWMALLLPNIATQFATFNAMGNMVRHGPVSGLEAGASGYGPVEQALASGFAQVGLLSVLAMICSLALFVMTVMPGKRGPNRFGPDPKDPDARPHDPDALDEDRWDALIAEAKRGDPDVPYKPIFDFGPGPVQPEPVRRQEPAPFPAQPQQQQWSNPAWDPGVAPSRPFGRRGA